MEERTIVQQLEYMYVYNTYILHTHKIDTPPKKQVTKKCEKGKKEIRNKERGHVIESTLR